MSVSQNKFEGISLLRAVATVFIMLYHVGYGEYYLRNVNFSAGIHLFFCISAFLIMLTTEKRTAGVFLKRRLVRILPLYIILTVLTFIAATFIDSFGQGEMGFGELIKSVFLIPFSRSGLRGESVIRPIVGPAWTLYYEIWFALVFFIAMICSRKYRGLIASAFCAILYAAGHALPDDLAISHILKLEFWFDFIAGIAIFHIWKLLSPKAPFRFPALWGAAAIGLTAFFYVAPGTNGPAKRFLLVFLAFMILLCTLISTARIHVPKAISFFAGISFSFYLLHYYVIIVLGKIFNFSVLSPMTAVGTLAVFAVSTVAAYISYLIIEIKLTGKLNQILKAK